jgi:hypothetical protein
MSAQAACLSENEMKVKLPGNECLMLLIAIAIAGCQSSNNQKKAPAQLGTIKTLKDAMTKKSNQTTDCDSNVVNNELSYHTLAFDVFKADTDKIKSLFLDPVVLKMEKRKNDEGEDNDLYDFTDDLNKIVLFRNPKEGFYIEDADIKNDKVRLNKKVFIGMEKEVFLKLLGVKSVSCDTVIIANDESTFESVYIFKDAKLREIKMGQTVE